MRFVSLLQQCFPILLIPIQLLLKLIVVVMVFNATYIVAVGFIGGNRRKPHTCRKSLTNFLSHNVVSSQYTSLLEGFKLKMLVVIGTNCIGSSLAECNRQYCNDYKHAKWLFFFRLAIIHKAVWNKLICFYLSFSKLMWTGIVSFCCPMLRTDWWTYKVNMTCIWLTFTNN